MSAAQNRRHEYITLPFFSKQGISRPQAVNREVPANTKIHRMHRVLDDLLRHGEKPRIVIDESLVQKWEKAHGGEK